MYVEVDEKGRIADPDLRTRLAEQSLRESEQRLRIALDAARLATWDWDVITDQISGRMSC